ncbi:helix-turn-helix domain-containing protein [Gracilibacillus thailandensis]|uniref:Helix-turn-helix domain-containing protein n=1 Tax=Gracilibacillus thailandensis TaxID=563735 RepID=A0A6N7R1N7_9BACI|nr:helix-turn-helix transcriptional regulator [Gracilibacillus thailandensis]MRI67355.1 helix-turn-helix domain-containing protein [Gracilibacillus thailandensis]
MLIFRERLKNLREEKDLMQEEVAKKLNISTSAYGYYEQGRNEPSLETVKQLAEIFEVTADYLLGLIDTKQHPVRLSEEIMLTEDEIKTVHLMKKEHLLEQINDDRDNNIRRIKRILDFIRDEF